MAIPSILALISLSIARSNYPEPKAVSLKRETARKPLGRTFWIYLFASLTTMIGFVYWGLVSYYAQDLVKVDLIGSGEIPILYIIAMAVDALIAVPLGVLYDKFGINSLIIAPVFAIPIPILLFTGTVKAYLYVAAVFWGLTMSFFETSMRAAVADVTTLENRSLAYGIYSFTLGIAWLTGGMLMSYLYQINMKTIIVIMTITTEIIAVILYGILIKLRRELQP